MKRVYFLQVWVLSALLAMPNVSAEGEILRDTEVDAAVLINQVIEDPQQLVWYALCKEDVELRNMVRTLRLFERLLQDNAVELLDRKALSNYVVLLKENIAAHLQKNITAVRTFYGGGFLYNNGTGSPPLGNGYFRNVDVANTLTTNTLLADRATIGDLTLTGSTIFSGNFAISGNETIDGNLVVTGSEFVGGTLTVAGSATLQSLAVEAVGANLVVTGSEFVGGTLTVTGSATFDNNVALLGSESINSNQVVTGNELIGGTLTVTGSATLRNSVTVLGSEALSGNLVITGSEFLSGTLTVTGSATLRNSVAVLGNETVSGNLLVTGSVVLNNTFMYAPATQQLTMFTAGKRIFNIDSTRSVTSYTKYFADASMQSGGVSISTTPSEMTFSTINVDPSNSLSPFFVSPTTFTAPVAGYYNVYTMLIFQSTSAPWNAGTLQLYKNGSPVFESVTVSVFVAVAAPFQIVQGCIEHIIFLAQGDTISVAASKSNGSSDLQVIRGSLTVSYISLP